MDEYQQHQQKSCSSKGNPATDVDDESSLFLAAPENWDNILKMGILHDPNPYVHLPEDDAPSSINYLCINDINLVQRLESVSLNIQNQFIFGQIVSD